MQATAWPNFRSLALLWMYPVPINMLDPVAIATAIRDAAPTAGDQRRWRLASAFEVFDDVRVIVALAEHERTVL